MEIIAGLSKSGRYVQDWDMIDERCLPSVKVCGAGELVPRLS